MLPLAIALRTIVLHEHRIVGWARALAAWRLGDQAPPWVATLPLVGATAVRQWAWVAHEASPRLEALASGHARQLMDWFVAEVGGLGVITEGFLLTVAIAAVLYATGERAALVMRRFLLELAGDQGDRILELIGKAIRGVVLGIGTIWLFAIGRGVAGAFLLAWTILLAIIDQAVRPYLMKVGLELPLPLVLVGVIGGLAAFGLVGIFVGPVTLAVAATLLDTWLHDTPQPAAGSRNAGS